MRSEISVALNGSSLDFTVGSTVYVTKLPSCFCVTGLLFYPYCSVFVALLCWQESIHRLSGTRIICYSSLCSNVRRRLASALSCQAKWWRRETEGKGTTLDVLCSLTPLLPWSSLNVCSIHQIYSTIVFPTQLFFSYSDNTAIPDEHPGSPVLWIRCSDWLMQMRSY